MIYLLIGPIGSGKTTVGKILSQKLNYEFVELDQKALYKSGYKNVQDAIQNNPIKLSECELSASKELSSKDNLVVACGGLSIFNQLNFDYFKDSHPHDLAIIYLQTPPKKQSQRLAKKHDGLSQEEILPKLKEQFEKRHNLYLETATKVIPTENNSVEDIVALILHDD